MHDNERAMYTGVSMCRNTEVTQRWVRTTLFFLIHSAGLSYTLARQQPTQLLLFIVSVGGLVLVSIWFLANWRTDQWIVYWQSRLTAIERSEVQPGGVTVFTGPDYERVTGVFFTFNAIVNLLIVVFTSLWLIVFVWAFLV